MANYSSNLKTWGASGSEYPSGYNYEDGEQPVDAWDNFVTSNIIDDLSHLISLTNDRIESESGSSHPSSPEPGHLSHRTDGVVTADEELFFYDNTNAVFHRLLQADGDKMTGILDMGGYQIEDSSTGSLTLAGTVNAPGTLNYGGNEVATKSWTNSNYNNYTSWTISDGDGTAETAAITSGETFAIDGGSGLNTELNSSENILVNHNDTSTQGNVSAAAGAAITDVNVDGFGHVTSLGTTDFDSRFLNASGDGLGGNSLTGVGRLSFSNTEFSDAPSDGTVGFDNSEGLKMYESTNAAWYQIYTGNRPPALGELSNVSASGEGSGGGFNADSVDGYHGGDVYNPSGMITIWSGSITNIPSGWVLCDGNNGTPNLQDKFVVGAGSSYAVGGTGGSATHTLTQSELASHSHGVGVSLEDGFGSSSGVPEGYLPDTHHSTTNTGGDSAHENRPPYHALAYIMKT